MGAIVVSSSVTSTVESGAVVVGALHVEISNKFSAPLVVDCHHASLKLSSHAFSSRANNFIYSAAGDPCGSFSLLHVKPPSAQQLFAFATPSLHNEGTPPRPVSSAVTHAQQKSCPASAQVEVHVSLRPSGFDGVSNRRHMSVLSIISLLEPPSLRTHWFRFGPTFLGFQPAAKRVM